MKKTKWIAALCLLLAVLTMGSTFARYVTTLSDSFNLSILAQKFILTYNAKGGNFADGETTISDVKYGNGRFDVISDVPNSIYGSFVGWDNAGTGDVENLKSGESLEVPHDGYTLRALWKAGDNLTDDLVQVVNPGENDYGVGVKGELSNFERIFINLGNLDPDYTYKIEFDYSVDGIYQASESGGHGWLVVDQKTMESASELNKNTYTTNYAAGLNPDLNPLVDGAFTDNETIKATNVHREGVFTPSSGNSYLWLDVSDFKDGGTWSYHYLNNLKVTKVGTAIKNNFVDGNASITNITENNEGNYAFALNAKDGTHERLAFPLDCTFKEGQNYKITFIYSGPTTYNNKYTYNFTVSRDIGHLTYKERNADVDDWTGQLGKNTTNNCELVFAGVDGKMYLQLHLAELADGRSHNIKISDITITETSETPTTLNFPFEDEEAPQIEVDISGISENIDWWMVDVEQQLPEPGKDYGLVFEPCEGYALAETVAVDIDGTEYVVNTDGSSNTEGVPTFDPDSGTLTIPAVLLTEETQTVTITAAAVPVAPEPTETEPDDPAEETAPTETTTPAETAPPVETEATDDTEETSVPAEEVTEATETTAASEETTGPTVAPMDATVPPKTTEPEESAPEEEAGF